MTESRRQLATSQADLTEARRELAAFQAELAGNNNIVNVGVNPQHDVVINENPQPNNNAANEFISLHSQHDNRQLDIYIVLNLYAVFCLFINGVSTGRSFVLSLADGNVIRVASVRLFGERLVQSGYRFLNTVTRKLGIATRERFGGGPYFDCGVINCDNDGIDTMKNLEEHYMAVHFNSKFQCPHNRCQYSSGQFRNVQQHLQSTTNHEDVIENPATKYISNGNESLRAIIAAITHAGFAFDQMAVNVQRNNI